MRPEFKISPMKGQSLNEDTFKVVKNYSILKRKNNYQNLSEIEEDT